MLGKLHARSESGEEGYRELYHAADVRQARLGMLLFAIPVLAFVVNDFALIPVASTLFSVIALRLALLALIGFGAFAVGKVESFRAFDLLVLAGSLAVTFGGGVINILRPEGFLVQSIITIIGVFVLYLVIPFRFGYQIIIASAATIGESAVIVFVLKPNDAAVLFTILFCMVIANLIAALTSWQIHSYRRRIYEDFERRKKMQETVEEYSKHLEELVTDRTKKLKVAERFAAIGATAGMVGHDLRNPLTCISGATYYLKTTYSDQIGEDGAEMLKTIEENVEYSSKIISDLLDYSRDIKLDLKKTTPRAVASEALAMVSFPTNIEVVNQVEEAPEIYVDSAKIKRVFVNIAKNAVDAMPEGGRLTVKSESVSSLIRISFADTGPGISEENQRKIFQPLFTTKSKGMGFGLAICQKMVEAHGGRILLESVMGKGSVFTVEFPIDGSCRGVAGQ